MATVSSCISQRGHYLLDLFLTDADMLVASVASHPPVGLSDHVTIIFSVAIAFEAETAQCTTEQPKITRKYQWANANFDAMSVYMYSIDWMQVIHSNPSAISMWTEFLKLL